MAASPPDRVFTDLELERYLAGDLDATRARELEARASGSDRARLDEIRAESAAFLGSIDVAAEVRAIGRKMELREAEPRGLAKWWRWIAGGGMLAAAAAALLLFILRAPDDPVDADLAIKGNDIALILHAPSGKLASGDVVAPGDQLRFEVIAPRRGFVAIIGVDGTGSPSIYVPDTGTKPRAYDPKSDRVLPGAIELDETPGDERFFALWSERAFAVDVVAAAVAARTPLPRGVRSVEVVLAKRPRQ